MTIFGRLSEWIFGRFSGLLRLSPQQKNLRWQFRDSLLKAWNTQHDNGIFMRRMRRREPCFTRQKLTNVHCGLSRRWLFQIFLVSALFVFIYGYFSRLQNISWRNITREIAHRHYQR